ncbi:hypothetical protein AXF42_Ash015028 [Apostasia shenzhenica]|uniref:Uncharacterized protein n=1 Tax=Apostasia shenzhenica TaxID=1088818 RepID=A0A2I0B2Y5_9ASPA|nr:hypothetical protein AXF42_Ash015028 [Apostasia shenzhenica]
MELVLESPIEALFFRYSAGLALLAAALGFFRFRFLGSTSASVAAASVSPSPDPSPTPPVAAPSPVILTAPSPDRIVLEEYFDSSPKRRFTAYFVAEEGIFPGDEYEEVGEEEEGGSHGICNGVSGGVEGFCLTDWGRRRGDLGWYRYQDRSAINGSFVRLWDGERRGSPEVRMRWI